MTPTQNRARALLSRDPVRSAEKALHAAHAKRNPLLAADYKRSGAWLQAARCYEEAGKLQEALQVVEEGCLSLERTVGGSPAGASRIAELNLVRAELLARAGRYTDAVHCYLKLGRIEEATRLAAKNPEGGRLQAQILLQTGRPAEAGDLLARHGLTREAAEAYEAAADWGRAAYRWETAQELVRAAQAYEKAGRPRDAARCYEAAAMPQRAAEVSTRTGSGAVSVSRRESRELQSARSCLAAGDNARAASLLLQMRPEEEGFGEGAILLAPLLIEEGFAQAALDRLNQIPRDAALRIEMEIEYWAGRGHEILGQTTSAIVCFERVAVHAPGHRDARERLEMLKNPRSPEPVASEPVVRPVAPATGFPVVGGMLAERYEILAELGRGGMGRVYKARDLELGEIVAIKTLLAPEEGIGAETRLLREVQICRRISHPNVVRVYDIGHFAGGLFVTMEHIEGKTLEKVVAEESPLPFARIRSLLCEIASGLQEAHGQGIVHRDLKPVNVMVTESRLKILDFGIASMAGIGARLTQVGCVMGTPMYMAPDQFRGREPDSRSDLYSLGLLAYTLIAGREPFDAAEPTILAIKQLHEDPPDIREHRPETPEKWGALLAHLLAKDPQDRFQTAHEVLDALTKLPV